MECIAIAPLVKKVSEEDLAKFSEYSQDLKEVFQVKHQGEYVVNELHQRIYLLEPHSEVIGVSKNNYLIETDEISYMVSIFTLDSVESNFERYLVRSIEDSFSGVIERALKHNYPNNIYPYRWVNRTIISHVKDIENISRGWVGRGLRRYEYYEYEKVDSQISLDFNVSWGNNIIYIKSGAVSDDIYLEFCKGMVDAQLIWINYENLTESSRHVAKTMNHGEFDTKKYTYLRDELLKVYKKRALLNIFLDEVETRLQGIRYQIAKMSLEAWGLESVKARLAINLEILESINNQNHNIVRSKAQSKVDKLLLVLSILTLTQFILMFVDLSYNGGASQVPGDGVFSFGLMSFIRSISADTWIVLSVFFTAFFTYFMMRGRE